MIKLKKRMNKPKTKKENKLVKKKNNQAKRGNKILKNVQLK